LENKVLNIVDAPHGVTMKFIKVFVLVLEKLTLK